MHSPPHVGGEPITRSQTRALRPVCLRIQFSRDYYFLLCHRYNEIRVRYYYMLFVDTRMRRGALAAAAAAGEGCFINVVFILLVS